MHVIQEDGFDHIPGVGYVQISDVHKSNVTFEPVNCTRRTAVYIKCSELGETGGNEVMQGEGG